MTTATITFIDNELAGTVDAEIKFGEKNILNDLSRAHHVAVQAFMAVHPLVDLKKESGGE